MELGRYGVTVNAISPSALTRMTENLRLGQRAAERPADAFDDTAPGNVAPLVVWLGSPESREVTGRVFAVMGGRISVLDGWAEGPVADKGARWDPAELERDHPRSGVPGRTEHRHAGAALLSRRRPGL